MNKEKKEKNKEFARKFRVFINQQLITQNINKTELAERAGMHPGSLSNIFSGKRRPSATTCVKLADALNISSKSVLRAAGYLSDYKYNDPIQKTFDEIKDTMAQLTPSNRKDLIQYARYRLQSQLAETHTRYGINSADDPSIDTPSSKRKSND